MKKITALLISCCLMTPLHAEGLKEYKDLKHRPLKTEPITEKVVERPCPEVFLETCLPSCANETCRAQCQQNAVPYCKQRQEQRAKESAKILLYVLLLASGPLLTVVDGPRNYDGGGGGQDPYTFYWDLPSFNVDLGAGLLSGGTFGSSAVGAFRYDHFGASLNTTYFTQGGSSLLEFDVGPSFYLGSTHLSAAISPVLLGSAGSGVKAEYGFGVRTSTTAYFGPWYLVFSPLLGKINALWQFAFRAGVGYRFAPQWGVHLVYDHHGVLDLNTLVISSASLNGALLYLSYRFN